MLDSSSLNQLKQLKADIRQEARRYQGLVLGSPASYGFVRISKGKQFFLPPEQMLRVFPGDRIEFCVKTDDKGRDFAEVEQLLSSDFRVFCGKCVQHGNAWFVNADVPRMHNRKFFLPPRQREGIAPGDWLQCELTRHPIKNGKAQATVKRRIESEDCPDFPSLYAAVNFHISRAEQTVDDAPRLLEQALKQDREDLTELPLVSIDAPDTGDIDDALCAVSLESGWELSVAIADPGSVVTSGTPLDRGARERAASSYLPHFRLPMLPAILSEDLLSLKAQETRPAILCKLRVSADGDVQQASFLRATVQSKAQLSYSELTGYLTDQSFPEKMEQRVRDSLQNLALATGKMREWRHAQQALIPDKPEFKMILDERGRVRDFAPIIKGIAHHIVEESMIAVNMAAARKLAETGTGIFATHGGFRSERLPAVQAILAKVNFEAKPRELNTLTGYRAALAHVCNLPEGAHLRNILSRFLQRGVLSGQSLPHLGLGVECYATITSPLRRFADLYNQRQLAAILAGEKPTELDERWIEALDQQSRNLRAASQWATQWLHSDYLTRNRNALKGQPMPATVTQVNPTGLRVRLDANGIEGFIEKRSLPSGMKFDPRRLSFRDKELSLSLDDTLQVTIAALKKDQREILLDWVREPGPVTL